MFAVHQLSQLYGDAASVKYMQWSHKRHKKDRDLKSGIKSLEKRLAQAATEAAERNAGI